MLLRKELWRLGFRYRLHQKIGAAKPDLVFTRLRVAVFVDGCFWHGCPEHYISPVGNASYWAEKITGNRARDIRNDTALSEAGWLVVRLWECEVNRNPSMTRDIVATALVSAQARIDPQV